MPVVCLLEARIDAAPREGIGRVQENSPVVRAALHKLVERLRLSIRVSNLRFRLFLSIRSILH